MQPVATLNIRRGETRKALQTGIIIKSFIVYIIFVGKIKQTVYFVFLAAYSIFAANV
jgi:hypothetical protein